jgi:hypothetical protein
VRAVWETNVFGVLSVYRAMLPLLREAPAACIVGFELDHRPHDNAHRRERSLERMEPREQRELDAGPGFVVRPKSIAKRLDHMVDDDAGGTVSRYPMVAASLRASSA